MSRTILWEPCETTSDRVYTSTPSRVIGALESAFGGLPVQLEKSDIQTLQGMSAMHNGKGDPFQELVDKLHENGTIKVWAE